jgi:hypothetical protein
MLQIRQAGDRGHFDHGWLDTWHSFSFGEYYDPGQMGFGPLRVINDDRVQAGQGFGMHGHRDMEIVTYVLEGALEHRDSLGNGGVMRYGDVQRMSAGSGIRHSEFNHSQNEAVHLLQIWLLPERIGLPPSYEQKSFADADKRGRLRLVASSDGREGSVTIHQDALVYAARLDGAESVTHRFEPGRIGYLQVARGELTLNGEALRAGDGVRISGESEIVLSGGRDAEVLLFDMHA